MTIGIDASRANKEQKTGTEWYSFFLIEELKKIAIDKKYKIILYSRAPLRGELAKLPDNWENKILRWPLKYLWTQGRLSLEMFFNSPDVLFIPAHSIPLIYAKNTIVTWHDIGSEKFKHLYSKASYYYHRWTVRYSLKHAKKIIVISKFTKNEIISFFKIEENKLATVYNGFDNLKYNNNLSKEKIIAVQEKYNIKNPYIFYIGRLEEKKNILGLVSAFALYKKEHKNDLKLVLAGKKGYGWEKIDKLIKKNNLQDDIIQLGWIEEDDVPYLMSGARIFMFLSHYEGFGIPLLEAMGSGAPIISSDIAPLREVAEDAALFVSPSNFQEIAEAINKVVFNDKLREELINKGLNRAKEFSWEKCARETLEILDCRF